jgi:hypothetical protein
MISETLLTLGYFGPWILLGSLLYLLLLIR